MELLCYTTSTLPNTLPVINLLQGTSSHLVEERTLDIAMSITTTLTAMTKHDLPRLMTRDEVAKLLGISPRTLSNWNSADRGPRPVKYGAQSVMYLPEDVKEWLYQQRAE